MFYYFKICSFYIFFFSAKVFVSCNFCGKSISYSCSAIPHQGRGFSQYGVSGSPTKSKVTSCPGCRKPLPRCALCLINMGTPVSSCPGTAPVLIVFSVLIHRIIALMYKTFDFFLIWRNLLCNICRNLYYLTIIAVNPKKSQQWSVILTTDPCMLFTKHPVLLTGEI